MGSFFDRVLLTKIIFSLDDIKNQMEGNPTEGLSLDDIKNQMEGNPIEDNPTEGNPTEDNPTEGNQEVWESFEFLYRMKQVVESLNDIWIPLVLWFCTFVVVKDLIHILCGENFGLMLKFCHYSINKKVMFLVKCVVKWYCFQIYLVVVCCVVV